MGNSETKSQAKLGKIEPLPCNALLNDLPGARQAFVESLRVNGFSVLVLTDEQQRAVADYHKAGAAFFASPLETKEQFGRVKTDEVLKGQRANAGYIRVAGLKEYLKLKLTDPETSFPQQPPDFKQSFKAVFEPFQAIAQAALLAVSEYQVKSDPKIKKKPQGNFTSAKGPNSYMEQKLFADVQSLASTRSSVSLIRYFKRAEDAKTDGAAASTATTATAAASTTTTTAPTAAPTTESAASTTTAATTCAAPSSQTAATASTSESKEKESKEKGERTGLEIATADDNEIEVACAEHTDTGILTLIMCAHVPGLQIADRSKPPRAGASTGSMESMDSEGSEDGAGFGKRQKAKASSKYEFLEVERMFEPGKHLFIIAGRKLTMFARGDIAADTIPSTVHRVMLPASIERSSLLYFMDARNSDG